MRSRFNPWNVLILLAVIIGILGIHPLNAQEAQANTASTSVPTLKEELSNVASHAAREAVRAFLEEKNLTAPEVVAENTLTTESPGDATAAATESAPASPLPGETWDDKLVTVINAIATQAFQGVEVTEALVKDFLHSPIGVLTVSIAIWEIVGKKLVALGLGIICLIFVLILAKQTSHNIFFGRRSLVKKEGKVKTYEQSKPLIEINDDAAGMYFIVRALLIIFLAILGIVGLSMGFS